MDFPVNTFKQKLLGRQVQLGLFLGIGSTVTTEIVAGCGYDFLLIDAEHGLNDVRSVQSQLQVLAAYDAPALVRPANQDPALIKQLLGAGAQTLLVPMVDDAEQARALVAATRYPPRGIRGVGTGLERGARWNAVTDYFSQVEQHTCLIVQIESRRGLEQLDAIAAVEGVDGVFIGPSDLSASLGYLGQPGHPEVQGATEQALRRIGAAGKAAGVFCADPRLAPAYQASGASFVALGADTGLLRNAARALLSSARGNATSGSRATY